MLCILTLGAPLIACVSVPSDWPTIPQLYVNGEFVGGCDIMLSSESGHISDLFRNANTQ